MKKTDFSRKYKISDAVPTDPTMHRISLAVFAETLKSFLEENFAGAVKVDIHMNTKLECYASLSPEYVAYFCKLLLSYLHGKALLNVIVDCAQNELRVRFEIDREWLLDRRQTADLIRAARNARFDVTLSDCGLLLTREVNMNYVYSIYAISTDILRAKLHEIFFVGYVPDEDE